MRGFSSLSFIPGTNEKHLLALKSVEDKDEKGDPIVESWVGVYTTRGEVVMEDVKLPWKAVKFEGIEFLDPKVTSDRPKNGFAPSDFDLDSVD